MFVSCLSDQVSNVSRPSLKVSSISPNLEVIVGEGMNAIQYALDDTLISLGSYVERKQYIVQQIFRDHFIAFIIRIHGKFMIVMIRFLNRCKIGTKKKIITT